MLDQEMRTPKKRTNLAVLDEELWNWAKFESRGLKYSSVAEYVFQLIKNDKEANLLSHKLLLELEKYFELNHYTLGDVANKTGLSIEYINDFLVKRNIPLNDDQKAIAHIHSLLIEGRVTPREAYLLNKLGDYVIRRRTFPEKRELITMFYEDSEERRNEIFSIAYEILDSITNRLSRKNKKKRSEQQGANLDMNQLRQRMAGILYEQGIDPTEEAEIFSDPHFEILTKNDATPCFLLAFELAGWAVISRDFVQIFAFSIGSIAKILIMGFKELFQTTQRINQQVQQSVRDIPAALQQKFVEHFPTEESSIPRDQLRSKVQEFLALIEEG